MNETTRSPEEQEAMIDAFGFDRPEFDDVPLNVTLVKVGVNMGDHAQDVLRAQVVDPCERVGDMVRRLLTEADWRGGRSIDHQSRIEIRVAEQVEPATVADLDGGPF